MQAEWAARVPLARYEGRGREPARAFAAVPPDAEAGLTGRLSHPVRQRASKDAAHRVARPGRPDAGLVVPADPYDRIRRLGAVRVAEPSMALHEHGEVDPTLSRTDSLREYRSTVIASIRTRTYRCAGAGWHRVREDIRGPTEDMPVRFQPMAALFHAG